MLNGKKEIWMSGVWKMRLQSNNQKVDKIEALKSHQIQNRVRTPFTFWAFFFNDENVPYKFIRLYRFYFMNIRYNVVLCCYTTMIHIIYLPNIKKYIYLYIFIYVYSSVQFGNKFGLNVSVNLENKPYLLDIEDASVSAEYKKI